MGIFTYKGYEGTCETSIEDEVCFGKILFIEDLILYQSETVSGLKKAFEETVEEYIKTCEELGITAKKPLKGQFNVRVSPELHKDATLKALNDNTSLNSLVVKALEHYVYAKKDINHFNVVVDVNENWTTRSISGVSTNPEWSAITSNIPLRAEHVRH